MVSELSIAILTTSVTLRVSHSSMPKIASQKNQKNTSVPTILDKILFEQIFKKINSQICDREEKMKKNGI